MVRPSTSIETIACPGPSRILIGGGVGGGVALANLAFPLFQVGAQRFGLPLVTFFGQFIVTTELFICRSLWLCGLVFRHFFTFPAILNKRHGAAGKKLRQGTLASEQVLWHCARLHA